MNGQKVFEALSEMTEDQRKCCSFWWLVDSRLIKNDVSCLVSEQLEEDISFTEESKIIDNIIDSMSVNDICKMLDVCETNMSDCAVDGYWDEYQGRYYSWLEDKVREYLTKEKENAKSSC